MTTVITRERILALDTQVQDQMIKNTLSALAMTGNINLSMVLERVLSECLWIIPDRQDISLLEPKDAIDAFAQIVRDSHQHNNNYSAMGEVAYALLSFYHKLIKLSFLDAFARSASGTITEREFFGNITPETVNPEEILLLVAAQITAREELDILSEAGCLTANFNPISWTLTAKGQQVHTALEYELTPVLKGRQPG